MSLVSLVVTLVIVGVLLWCLNSFAGEYIDAKILKLINVAVVVICVLYVLYAFVGGGHVGDIRVPQVRW